MYKAGNLVWMRQIILNGVKLTLVYVWVNFYDTVVLFSDEFWNTVGKSVTDGKEIEYNYGLAKYV